MTVFACKTREGYCIILFIGLALLPLDAVDVNVVIRTATSDDLINMHNAKTARVIENSNAITPASTPASTPESNPASLSFVRPPEKDSLALRASPSFQDIWNQNGTSKYNRVHHEHSSDTVNIQQAIARRRRRRSIQNMSLSTNDTVEINPPSNATDNTAVNATDNTAVNATDNTAVNATDNTAVNATDNTADNATFTPEPTPLAELEVAQEPEVNEDDYSMYRLPTSVYPLHYDLELQPNFVSLSPEHFTYKGKVSIQVRCLWETESITLHWNGSHVDPSSIKVYLERSPFTDGSVYDKVAIDSARHFFIIHLTKSLEAGNNYRIEMQFSGTIGNVSEGIYYTSYKLNNDTRYLIATQFNPVHARKVFPCFDEPGMKATFKLTLIRKVQPGCTAISNMRPDEDILIEDGKEAYEKVDFQQTPLMSTHALAFVIFEDSFAKEIIRDKDGVDIRIWVTEQSSADTQFASDQFEKLYEYFTDGLGTRHPLEKLDIIGLPAVESSWTWGLGIHRESNLLYNNVTNSEKDKENVVRMLSYQTAHQWFGSSVNPIWWSDTWLTEGFAGFYEHAAMDEVNPEWEAWHQFVMDKLHVALKHDATFDTRPVHSHVESSTDVRHMFDWLMSTKAPSLVRMMRFFLGNETFGNGIKKYLDKFQHKAVTPDHFYEVMNEEASENNLEIDVKDIMESWILQANYPVVTVTRDFNNKRVVHATQERFLSNPTARDPLRYTSPYSYRWTIPLTICSSLDKYRTPEHTDVVWLTKDERSKTIVGKYLPEYKDTDGWILANIEQRGYYRVNYHPGNWQALSKQLEVNNTVFHPLNRAQIINDAWNLAKANYFPLDIALDTVKYLDKETEYLPWFTAWRELEYVNLMLMSHPLYESFQAFMADKLNNSVINAKLAIEADGHMEKFAQSLIAEQACYFGVKDCEEEVVSLFNKWMKTPTEKATHTTAGKVIYCYGIAQGGWDEWNFVLQKYKKAETDSEKTALLLGLTCAREPSILNHCMELLLKEAAPFLSEHALPIIINIAKNPNGRFLVWEFFVENYKELRKRYHNLDCEFVLPEFAEQINTELELEDIKVFALNHCSDYFLGKFEVQTINKIENNIDWMKRHTPTIKTWMEKNGYFSE